MAHGKFQGLKEGLSVLSVQCSFREISDAFQEILESSEWFRMSSWGYKKA